MKNDFKRAEADTQYSYFTNKYTLTKEMCAELEASRIDIGLLFIGVVSVILFIDRKSVV